MHIGTIPFAFGCILATCFMFKQYFRLHLPQRISGEAILSLNIPQ
mgnify:CR=1 FL=1